MADAPPAAPGMQVACDCCGQYFRLAGGDVVDDATMARIQHPQTGAVRRSLVCPACIAAGKRRPWDGT